MIDNNDNAWDRQTMPAEDAPHAWIQWKGTDVCMDVICECGEQGHIDADFAYYVRCAACSKVYMCNGHIELVPLLEGETAENSIPFGEKGALGLWTPQEAQQEHE